METHFSRELLGRDLRFLGKRFIFLRSRTQYKKEKSFLDLGIQIEEKFIYNSHEQTFLSTLCIIR